MCIFNKNKLKTMRIFDEEGRKQITRSKIFQFFLYLAIITVGVVFITIDEEKYAWVIGVSLFLGLCCMLSLIANTFFTRKWVDRNKINSSNGTGQLDDWHS